MNADWISAVERALRVEIAAVFGVAPHLVAEGTLAHPDTGHPLAPAARSTAISLAAGVIFAEHKDPVWYEQTARMGSARTFTALVRHTATTFDITLSNRVMFAVLDAFKRSGVVTRPSRELDDGPSNPAQRARRLKTSFHEHVTTESPGWTARELESVEAAKTYGDLRTILVEAERRRIVQARKKD